MPPRPRLRRELLHLATDLAAVAENPADVEHVFDLLSRSYATPAADTARACLRADPRIALLLAERYAPPWPELAELLALPSDTLGGRYGRWFGGAGLPPPPEPVLAAGTAADDQWLHLRVRHTHDLWHVVSGCPPSVAGEVALNAVNVMQLRWPGGAMLLGADLLHRCLVGPGDHGPDLGLAAAFGLQLGHACEPLLAQRWEEGWERPLEEWRERLGIAVLLATSPFLALEATWGRAG